MLKFDDNTINLIKYINKCGFKAYIVGGAIRNQILGIEVKDIDIVIDINENNLYNIFSKYNLKKYKNKEVYGLNFNESYYEITILNGLTIEENLRNRDFKINAIAYNLVDGIIDPLNGLYDIKNKVISSCAFPEKCINADPIRILRTIRFEASLGFTTQENLYTSIIKNCDIINLCSKELIAKELNYILLSDVPSYYIRKYKEVFFEIITDLKKCYKLDQHNPYHSYDVFDHIMKVLDKTALNLVLRLAALYHDIGKPKTFTIDNKGIGHFYNHYTVSMEIVKKDLTDFGYSHDIVTRVSHLVLYHDNQVTEDKKSQMKFLKMFGTNDIDLYFNLKRADIYGQNPDKLDRLDVIDKIYLSVLDLIKSKVFIEKKDLKISIKDINQITNNETKSSLIYDNIYDLVLDSKLNNEHKVLIEYIKKREKINEKIS